MKTTDNKQTPAPILALHGTASNATQWKALIQCTQGKRIVYTPDIAGYGQIPLTNKVGLVPRLEPLLQSVHNISEPMHLVAHSFGGALGLKLAELLPDKFLSVSLYEPTTLTVLKASAESEDIEHIDAVKLLARRVTRASPLDAMAYFIGFWMGPTQWSKMASANQSKLAAYANVASRDFSDALYELEQTTSNRQYSGPLHILYGSQTVSMAKRIAHLFKQQYAKCQVTELDGLNHMGPIQQPIIVNQALMQYIEMTEKLLLKS